MITPKPGEVPESVYDLEQRYLKDIAGEVGKLSNYARSDQKERLAQSVAIAGISHELSTLGSSASRLVSMTEIAIPAFAAQLAQSSKLLSELLEVMSNPRRTAARESANLGERAMRNGWYDDAAAEFEQALASEKYDPGILLNLGICRAALGDEIKAVGSFERAVKYDLGKVDRPSGGKIACGAALFAAEIHRRAGRKSSAVEILSTVQAYVNDCPELDHSYANLTGDIPILKRALSAAPELALDAVRRSTPNAESVSAQLLHDLRPELRQAVEILDELRSVDPAAEIGRAIRAQPITGQGSAVELATTWSCLSDVLTVMRRLDASIGDKARRESMRIESEITHQRRLRREAESKQERAKGSGASSLFVLVFYGLMVVATFASCSAGWPEPGNDDSPGLAILGLILFMGCVWATPTALGSVLALFESTSATGDATRRGSESVRALREIERTKAANDLHILRHERVSRSVQRIVAKHTYVRTVPFLGSVTVDWTDEQSIDR